MSDLKQWINPAGSYGDILMISGILKQLHDLNPKLKFNIVRRASHSDLLMGHPAISNIGTPPPGTKIIHADYRLSENVGIKNQRPYQILARLLGLQTPAEEKLYLPRGDDKDKLLHNFLPVQGKKIAVISSSSHSPRKMMSTEIWKEIVRKLNDLGVFVIQVGRKDDLHVKGAYSILGLTDLRQLISLLRISDIILSLDNFLMHAARLTGKPAIIIWGPTNPEIYGYPDLINIQGSGVECELRDECLKPGLPVNDKSACPISDRHCMNVISADEIVSRVTETCFT